MNIRLIPASLVLFMLAAIVPATISGWTPAMSSERDGRLIGELRHYRVKGDETFHDIARRFGLGYVELVAANPGIDPWIPATDAEIVLPTWHIAPPSLGYRIIVNRSDMRIYLYSEAGVAVASWPVGLGRTGWATPVGMYRVSEKRENPVWYPPKSIRAGRPDLPRAIPPGPANPLGHLALRLDWDGYAIHGTNEPLGVGRRVSHGCIRLYPEDIEALYEQVAIGASVLVVDQPIKITWHEGHLYLEVSPSDSQIDALEIGSQPPVAQLPNLKSWVQRAVGSERHRLDWTIVEQAGFERRGVPVRITSPSLMSESETIYEDAD